MSALVRPCLPFLVLALLAACGDEAPPAAMAPRPKVAQAVDAGAPEIDTSLQYVYHYDSQNKRDPFRSERAKTGTFLPGDQDVCTEALCQFDLEELRLVAVVSGDANPMAMVEDRTGFGHVMRKNSKVGRGGGKVTAIDRNCVEITSYRAGPDGRMVPEKQKLCVDIGVSEQILEQVTQ